MYAMAIDGRIDQCLLAPLGYDVIQVDYDLYKKTRSVLDILGVGSNQMTGFECICILHGMRTI